MARDDVDLRPNNGTRDYETQAGLKEDEPCMIHEQGQTDEVELEKQNVYDDLHTIRPALTSYSPFLERLIANIQGGKSWVDWSDRCRKATGKAKQLITMASLGIPIICAYESWRALAQDANG